MRVINAGLKRKKEKNNKNKISENRNTENK